MSDDSSAKRPFLHRMFAGTYLEAGFMTMVVALFFAEATASRAVSVHFFIAGGLACLADYLLVRAFQAGGRVVRVLSVFCMLPSLYMLAEFVSHLPQIGRDLKYLLE